LGGKFIDANPFVENDEVFLPVDFIKKHIDEYIYWDAARSRLTVTTENKVIRMNTEELTSLVNNKPVEINIPVYKKNGAAYMPQSMALELYNISIVYDPKYNLAIIDNLETPRKTAEVLEATIRHKPDIKSPIAEKNYSGTLTVYEASGDFTRARTESGLLGYAETKSLTNFSDIPAVFRNEVKTETQIPIKGKLNLVWDLITTPEANSDASKRETMQGVNILSPTWFSFDLEKMNGDLINIADKSYTDWAHKNGYQVWAMLSDNYDPSVVAEILSDTLYREHIVNQLLTFISLYDLDGINLDFERATEKTIDNFLQFLRELSPLLKEANVVLSVDLYVPIYTKYYNRTEIAKSVDFACVMTYDEHTGKNAGPVASYNYVKEGIEETMREIPREKILMGIPFYSRIWRDGERYAEYGRDLAIKTFESKGAELIWLEELKLFYATYSAVEDGREVKYETWIEEERAISEKMRIAKEYDLAGVASWQRGLGVNAFYEVISQKLN
jgi:spore germination protein YaaH